MQKTYIHPDIYYIEDFLTEEELGILYNEALEENWIEDDKQIALNLRNNWTGKIKRTKNLKLMHNMRLRLQEQLSQDKKHLVFTNSRSLKRYRVGDLDQGGKYAMNPHHDGIKDPWELGAIVYLNDDFEGGELTYENLNISLKVKPGTLVVHKANDDCTHRVEAVTKGTRYMITFFAGDPANEQLRDLVPHENDK